jgi:hypothetical protein
MRREEKKHADQTECGKRKCLIDLDTALKLFVDDQYSEIRVDWLT